MNRVLAYCALNAFSSYLKKIGLHALILFTVTSFQPLKGDNVQILARAGAGFFSDFFSVLNHLTWCDKHNLTPYVYWDWHSLYFEKDLGGNVWEYYFEQLSDFKFTANSTDVDIRNTYGSVDNFSVPWTGGYHLILKDSFRQYMNYFIEKYIKVKPHIRAIVEQFYRGNFEGKTTIGIHLRGTDKIREIPPVSVETICAQANKCAEGLSNVQFFVATDEEILLTQAKQLLAGPVISYDSYRSENGYPIHKREIRINHRYMLGEDVLVEVLLLAKCSQFIHTRTNVATAVLLFNPEIKNFLLT